jgi:hypothetical protein
MLEEQPAERDGAGAPSIQRPADAAQSSSGANEEPEPLWTYVLAPQGSTRFKSEAELLAAREAYIRDVRAFIATGYDDPNGTSDAWCKENAEKIAETAIWAAEKALLSYWAAKKALDQARAAAGVPLGAPRAKHFIHQVRSLHERQRARLKERERTGR